ncbi:acVLRF1 family peptidyl-tRNA hydrolase [Actinoplanes sp. RD1]|uniref:acVLRF1 family peptidyl-tRNA hydrolase n=1 Tax=Actinoplanes sp. RD1 TaxID=3064538 RepID=UPI0027408187|nr:acVLRF1 family peptidyl-tRNA hydrolase [Actinoplanes sp. RD1]
MSARPAAGGGRWVDVAPERLPRWLENFGARHGGYAADGLVVTGADGATAELFPPPGCGAHAGGPGDLAAFAAEAAKPRRIGLLLARKGAVAVGVADGTRLVTSKVDTHYVQGRTAAGGWSQQRFARRRDNQAKAAAADGAAIAGRLLLPETTSLCAVVTGGDRAAVDAILAAPALAPVLAMRDERFLDVPEPRHAVLEEAVALARTVRVLVRDPAAGA